MNVYRSSFGAPTILIGIETPCARTGKVRAGRIRQRLWYKSHPGHLPLLSSRLWFVNLLDFDASQTERQSKRLPLCLDSPSRPKPASYGLTCNGFATLCPARVASSIKAQGPRVWVQMYTFFRKHKNIVKKSCPILNRINQKRKLRAVRNRFQKATIHLPKHTGCIAGADGFFLWFPSQNRTFSEPKPYVFGTETVRFWDGERKRETIRIIKSNVEI